MLTPSPVCIRRCGEGRGSRAYSDLITKPGAIKKGGISPSETDRSVPIVMTGSLKFPGHLILLLLLLFAVRCGGAVSEEVTGDAVDSTRKAAELAREILILDTHIDTPDRLRGEMEDISRLSRSGEFDYDRARQGGLDAAFMAIYVPAEYQQGGARALADTLIDLVASWEESWPDRFVAVDSPDQVEIHFGSGRVALALGIENGAAIEDDLRLLAHFYSRGVRYITLAHGKANLICDSSYDSERPWGGLSPFGREVVREMNELGMMVDVSHVSDDAFFQVLEVSEAPVIASHSSCRRFTPGWERNLSDDMIQALAERGGVIQINFGGSFLNDEYRLSAAPRYAKFADFLRVSGLGENDQRARAFRDDLRRQYPVPRVTVADVADHIDHVVRLAGIDHVGLGSDFDGVGGELPVDLRDVSQYPNLIRELLARGYSEDDLRKICSGNLLRVWREVERLANNAVQAEE